MFLKKLNFLDWLDDVRVRFSIVFTIGLYLIILFRIAIGDFNSTDKVVKLIEFKPSTLREMAAFSVKVNTGIFIRNFPEFDAIKNKFIIDAIVWFEYNPREIMLETIERFSFDKGVIRKKSKPDIKISSETLVLVKYNVLFELKGSLTYYKFPLQDHRLSIVLSNDFVDPSEVYYMTDQAASFNIPQEVFPTNWEIYSTQVSCGYLELELDKQDKAKKTSNPKALFVINFRKASIRKLLIIFIPIFSAIFLSLFSFLISIGNFVGRFSLAITSVTSLLGYRFVIEHMMPSVGYFTTTDLIYIFLLMFAFMNFIIHLMITRYYFYSCGGKVEETKKKGRWLFFNNISLIDIYNVVFVLMVILFVVVNGYILLK